MFDSLRSLSDTQLIPGSKVARAQEHSGLLAMVDFIAETGRPQLFFSGVAIPHCTAIASESSTIQAMRRITAARCIVKFPDVPERLKAYEISLAKIFRVSKIPKTVTTCSTASAENPFAVEAIVAEHEPVPASVFLRIAPCRTPRDSRKGYSPSPTISFAERS